MRPLLLVVLLAVGACTLPGSGADEPSSTPAPEAAPTGLDAPVEAPASGAYRAPEFPQGLDWINTDRPLALADLAGKIVLLDFWTSGCVNCLNVIPDVERLLEEYPDELVVVGVHSGKFDAERETDAIREFVLQHGIRHPVVNDAAFEVWGAYQVRAWPTAWLIGPDGALVGRHEGEGVYEVVQPVIEEVLATRGELVDTRPFGFAPEQRLSTVLSYPSKLAVDGPRDRLYVADTGHHQVVVVELSTGRVLDVIGSGTPGYRDGGSDEASFDGPRGLAVSPAGEVLFVADTGTHTIRAVDIETGLVTTLAGTGRQGSWPPRGGPAGATPLHSPWDLELVDGTLVVAMAGSHQLWALDLADLTIGPWAGSGREATTGGPRRGAALAQPSGLASDGDRIWFADAESSSIRVVTDDEVRLVAGATDDLFTFGLADGVGAEARLQHPLGVAWDGETLWVADTYNSAIRGIDPTTGATTTLAGGEAGWADGPDPAFDQPGGIEVWDGRLFVADTNNHSIRIVDPTTGAADTLVLAGIERFRTPTEDGIVAVPPVVLADGAVTITLDVDFPEGFKVNPDAPASFVWGGDAGAVTPADTSIVAPEFPISFGFEPTGPGVLVGEVGIVYCEKGRESICLFEEVRFEVPVAIDPAGGSSIDIVHEVSLPGGLLP
ncbi:MAG: thioredoxin-like domain-containing protein [Acidimicrobiia bacterium]